MRHRLALVAAVIGIALFLGVLPAVAQQAQEKRFALLIGNQAYDTSVGVLKNPHNDVGLMAVALANQGFEILPLVKDAKRSAILGSVRELAGRLKTAGTGAVGFFYYSGHGAAEKDTGINYIIPVDAREPGSTQFWDESLKLDDIMKLLDQARGAVKFVVFDACRNELQLPTRDTTKGLVPIADQQGFFVAYASAPGRTASDRGERSGPYAAALASELARQGLDHLNLFQNVKEAVIASTGGSQNPWESNGLTRRVYLTGEPTTPADMALWESVRTTGDAASLQRYLERFPAGVFAATAKQMIERLKSETAQRERDATERKAQETRQAAALRAALAEAQAAREAVTAAEAKRVAAERAVSEAGRSSAPAVAEDTRLTREALAAAEAKRRDAELRVAALEKAEQERKEAIEILRKQDEAAATRAEMSLEAIRKGQEEQKQRKEVLLSDKFFSLNDQCRVMPPPAVEIVKKPSFGTVVVGDVETVVTSIFRKDRQHCLGAKGPARTATYVINDKDRERTGIDAMTLRLRHSSGVSDLLEFEVDLGQRTATRTKITRSR